MDFPINQGLFSYYIDFGLCFSAFGQPFAAFGLCFRLHRTEFFTFPVRIGILPPNWMIAFAPHHGENQPYISYYTIINTIYKAFSQLFLKKRTLH